MNRHLFLRNIKFLATAVAAVAFFSTAAASTDDVRELLEKDQWMEALAQARALVTTEPGPASTAALG